MHLKRVRPFNHASFNFFCSARCARHPATSSSLLMRQPSMRPTSGVDGCRACLCEYTIIKTTIVNTVTSMQFAELRVIRRRQHAHVKAPASHAMGAALATNRGRTARDHRRWYARVRTSDVRISFLRVRVDARLTAGADGCANFGAARV